MPNVDEAAGGFEGLLDLAHAWHERVLADEVVRHAFQGGTKPDDSERLAAYWGKLWAARLPTATVTATRPLS